MLSLLAVEIFGGSRRVVVVPLGVQRGVTQTAGDGFNRPACAAELLYLRVCRRPYTQSSTTDTQYYSTALGKTGLWIWPNYWTDWCSQACLGTAMASLFQWHGINGHTNSAADQAINNWLRYTEITTIEKCISDHLMPNGDWPN